jgi:hypothetical protein
MKLKNLRKKSLVIFKVRRNHVSIKCMKISAEACFYLKKYGDLFNFVENIPVIFVASTFKNPATSFVLLSLLPLRAIFVVLNPE